MIFTCDGKEVPVDGVGPVGACGDGEAAWRKSAGVRIVVFACLLAIALYLILRTTFISVLIKLLVAMLQVLLLEIALGMIMQRRRCNAISEQERKICQRTMNKIAWCAEVVMNGFFLACVRWVFG